MKLPERTSEKPALGVALDGKVNGKFYPIFDIDVPAEELENGWGEIYSRDLAIQSQRIAGFHTAHLYRTHSGFQLRFFYDHVYTLKEVRELVAFFLGEQYVDKKYLEIVGRYIPNGRAAGKWKVPDIRLVAVIAKHEGLTEQQQKVGDSLAALYDKMRGIKLPKKYLLDG